MPSLPDVPHMRECPIWLSLPLSFASVAACYPSLTDPRPSGADFFYALRGDLRDRACQKPPRYALRSASICKKGGSGGEGGTRTPDPAIMSRML